MARTNLSQHIHDLIGDLSTLRADIKTLHDDEATVKADDVDDKRKDIKKLASDIKDVDDILCVFNERVNEFERDAAHFLSEMKTLVIEKVKPTDRSIVRDYIMASLRPLHKFIMELQELTKNLKEQKEEQVYDHTSSISLKLVEIDEWLTNHLKTYLRGTARNDVIMYSAAFEGTKLTPAIKLLQSYIDVYRARTGKD